MKTQNIINKSFVGIVGGLLGLVLGFSSCSDKVDTSNLFTSKAQTMTEYIDSVPDYSSMAYIFKQVNLGSSSDASSLASVLSAYGNYTCFVPTNEAVANYVKSLHSNAADSTDVHLLTADQMKNIAYSCVIDNGNSTAYTSLDFLTEGSLSETNLNDRLLTVAKDTVKASSTYGLVKINGSSFITKSDIKVSNGYIHQVNAVISPSSSTVSDLMDAAANMKIMSRLLQETGWASVIAKADYDKDYESVDRETFKTNVIASNKTMQFYIPQRKYLGYTVFAETDSVLEANGVSAPVLDASGKITDDSWATIKSQLMNIATKYYGTSNEDDLTNTSNPLYKFTAYHILPGRFSYNNLLHHYNEYGYKYGDAKNPQSKNYSVDVWDFYCTAGTDRFMLKFTQVPDHVDIEHPIYLNRHSTYNDGILKGDYTTKSTDVPGIMIHATNYDQQNNTTYDNNARNGMYFPITGLLVYDETVKNVVLNDRLRIDMFTMFPELSSLNIRGKRYKGNNYYCFPSGFIGNILDVSAETNITYLANTSAASWRDYQGDEFIFAGLFDFTLRLPPVPKTGTYEIRIGTSNNPQRGMAQAYFGTADDKGAINLKPAGLPVDLRQTSADFLSLISWVQDGTDEDVIRQNDKNMRNQGWMKGPNYFSVCNGTGSPLGRTYSTALRRIIATETLEAGKTYYLRFKTSLNASDAEFFMDYIELVPSSVYAGTTPENIW